MLQFIVFFNINPVIIYANRVLKYNFIPIFVQILVNMRLVKRRRICVGMFTP